MAKKIDPVQAKAAKQKRIAIIGGVLLLGLLAFQVPRTMKMLNGQGTVTTSASTAPATTTAAGSTALAPPTLDGGSTSGAAATGSAASAVDTSADGVADPGTPPPSSGQLMSFSRFKSKDPFRQQVQDCPTGDCGGAPAAAASTSAGTGTSGGTTTSTTAATTGTKTSTTGAAVKATVATISVNGAAEQVAAKKDFPASSPVFTLVSLTRTQAMIAIAGGSLESGASAVALKLGKTLKLQNTADGTTYVLRLIATA